MANDRYDERVIDALLRIPYQVAVARICAGLAEAGHSGVSPAHLVIWAHIRTEGSRITELARQAQITKQSISYLIDHLETHGYVERVSDPSDGRAKIVRLTERGWAVDRAAREIGGQVETEWARSLGEERVHQLRQILSNLSYQLGG